MVPHSAKCELVFCVCDVRDLWSIIKRSADSMSLVSLLRACNKPQRWSSRRTPTSLQNTFTAGTNDSGRVRSSVRQHAAIIARGSTAIIHEDVITRQCVGGAATGTQPPTTARMGKDVKLKCANYKGDHAAASPRC